MGEEQYSLSWDNFHKNMSNGMQTLLENEDLVDVTLAVEGKYLKAHKFVLSICSPYFKELFQTNPCKHPIVFMKDVSFVAMNDLLTFMYQGEVQVNQENINVFIKTAEALQIQGITGESSDLTDLTEEHYHSEEVLIKPVTIQNKPKGVKKILQPSLKRRRLSTDSEKEVDIPTTEEIIEFKMEPFDDSQPGQHLNESYEHLDDVANEDYRDVGVDDGQLDDTGNIDDPEDFSMLGSEDEPKPGTSNEVAVSDGQVNSDNVVPVKETSTKKRRPPPQKVIHQGFVYHVRLQHHGKTRYFRCAKERYTGCMATAKMDINAPSDQLTVIRPHNHPPDTVIEEKTIFENQLRRAVQTLINTDVKSVYNSVAAIYPDSARLFPFGTRLYCKMKRWRRTFLQS